jgi:pimeloyl-ACP methyl ester carboxylesterase
VTGQPIAAQRSRPRLRKWLRRLGLAALLAFAVTTAFSLVVNAVTRPPAVLAPGFGGYVEVGSTAVHYETWGSSGSPIVLVPGFLESTTAFSTVAPLLAEYHTVYALDLPGYGYTRYTGPMRLRSQADLVDGFITALHLVRPTLVGHSLGAAVSGSVALNHPDDVGKVVFADGDGLKIDLGPRWLRSLILASPFPTTAIRIGPGLTPLDKWLFGQVCGPHCPSVSTALLRQWLRPLRQRSEEHALRALMVNADYGLTPAQISSIAVPTAIIWGSEDQQGGSLAAAITNLHHPPVHTIGGAGHLTMIADPAAFARAVESS